MASVCNVNELLEEHVALDIECLDRLYLNAYVPNLQVGGQVIRFMKDHLGVPVPSPAIFERIGNRFREAVKEFAEADDIPIVRFKKGDRRIDVMRPYLDAATGPGVAAIGVAQEFQWVFSGYKRPTDKAGAVNYGFDKAEPRVTRHPALAAGRPRLNPRSVNHTPYSRLRSLRTRPIRRCASERRIGSLRRPSRNPARRYGKSAVRSSTATTSDTWKPPSTSRTTIRYSGSPSTAATSFPQSLRSPVFAKSCSGVGFTLPASNSLKTRSTSRATTTFVLTSARMSSAASARNWTRS